MRTIGPGQLLRLNRFQGHAKLTILFMKLLDFPYVLARLDHIIVAFIPRGQGRECGTRNVGEWTQEQSVYGSEHHPCQWYNHNCK